MNRPMLASLAVGAAAFAIASCSTEEKKTEPQPAPAAAAPLSVEESATVVTTSRVDAIDHTSRRITLRSPSGRKTTFTVGPQVQRLSEVKVGDTVTGEHNVSLQAELRAPTAEEAANPIMVVDITGRAPQGDSPAGGEQRRVRVVTTVEAVDIPNMRVTLKGPMGDTTKVRARNPENIKKLHVGDTIVINYVESTVITLTNWHGQ